MISTRSVGLLIDTVVCLTLAKWETVSGRFGGYLILRQPRASIQRGIFTHRSHRRCRTSEERSPSCASMASIGNNRAKAISENGPNYEPDSESDREVRHHMTYRPIVRISFLARRRARPEDRRARKKAPVSDLGRDKLPTPVDIAWQILFRLGFPVARIWRRHVGALVAIHVGQSLLLLRSSYRSDWNFPGGSVRQGETPEVSVRRELAEEIGLVANAPLQLVGEVSGVWDGRIDRVFLFVF